MDTLDEIVAASSAETKLNTEIASLETRLCTLYRERELLTAKIAAARGAALTKLDRLATQIGVDCRATAFVDIAAGVKIALPVVPRDNVPVGRYVAIAAADDRFIPVYNFNGLVVSCTPVLVGEDKKWTQPCSNPLCGDSDCKFYHDPLKWPASDHKFAIPRHQLCRTCPYFGDYYAYESQIPSLSADNLAYFAKYIATMGLFIKHASLVKYGK